MMLGRYYGDGSGGHGRQMIQFLKNEGSDFKCLVNLPDGGQLNVPLKKSSKGNELLAKIFKFFHLTDSELFSCTFNDCSTSTQVWLKAEKKLSKQLKNNLPIFNFRVKFYPCDHSDMKDQNARLLLFQQIRKDIFEERIPCSFVTHALLLSLCAQSDHGDWDYCHTPKGRGLKIASNRDFRDNIDEVFSSLEIPKTFERMKSELHEKIYELYRGHKGLSRDDAINHYLDNARKLARYGMHSIHAEDVEGDMVELNVSNDGITVYREGLRIARFTWPRLIKIAYRKNKFILEDRSLNDKRQMIVFRFAIPKEAKRFWRLCVEHHSFFRLGNKARTLPRLIESRSSRKPNNFNSDASSCVVVVYDDSKNLNVNERRFLPSSRGESLSNNSSVSTVCNGYQGNKINSRNFRPSNFNITHANHQIIGDRRRKCKEAAILERQLQQDANKCCGSFEGSLNCNPGVRGSTNASNSCGKPENSARLPCGCPSSDNIKRFTNRSIDFNISGSVSIEETEPNCYDNQIYNNLQHSVVRSSSLTNNYHKCSTDGGGRDEEKVGKQPIDLKHRHSLVGVENIKPVCIIEASERPRLSSIDGKNILSRFTPGSHQQQLQTQQHKEHCQLYQQQLKHERHKTNRPTSNTYDNIDVYVEQNVKAAGKIRMMPTTPDILPQVFVSEDIVHLHERDQISPSPLQLSAPILSATFPPSPILNVSSSRAPTSNTSPICHHNMWDHFESYPMDVVSLPPSPKKPLNLLLSTFNRGSSHSPQTSIESPPKRDSTLATEYSAFPHKSEPLSSMPQHYMNLNNYSLANLRHKTSSSPSSPSSVPPIYPLPDLNTKVSACSRGASSLPVTIENSSNFPPPPPSFLETDDCPLYSTIKKSKQVSQDISDIPPLISQDNPNHKTTPSPKVSPIKAKFPPPVPPKRDLTNTVTTKNVVITAYLDPTKLNNEQGVYDNCPSNVQSRNLSLKTFRGRSKSVDDDADGYYDNLPSQPSSSVADDSTFRSSPSSSFSSSSSSLTSMVQRRASVGSSFVTFDTPDGYRITEVRRSDDNSVIETMVEKTLVIQSKNFIDQDKAIADAITSLSKINPGLSVEEIKINTIRQ